MDTIERAEENMRDEGRQTAVQETLERRGEKKQNNRRQDQRKEKHRDTRDMGKDRDGTRAYVERNDTKRKGTREPAARETEKI